MLHKKKVVFRHYEKTFKKRGGGDEKNSPNGIAMIGFRQ